MTDMCPYGSVRQKEMKPAELKYSQPECEVERLTMKQTAILVGRYDRLTGRHEKRQVDRWLLFPPGGYEVPSKGYEIVQYL